MWYILNIGDLSRLRKIVNIKLFFEGPSDWSVREFINIINEYLFERLPIILNNVLEPYGIEASLLDEEKTCRILGSDMCKDRVVVSLHDVDTERVIAYVVYKYRAGDNTFEFLLEKLVST